ncbi:MAG: hypothetical protein WC091_20340 [Sulfuricellaceae bacterium]
MLKKEMIPVGAELTKTFSNLAWNVAAIGKVIDLYKAYRDEAEALMRNLQDPGHALLIDRHKIGASFIMAIIEAEPLAIKDGALPAHEGELLRNEVLAFRTAVRILAGFNKHDARLKGISAPHWSSPVVYPPTKDSKPYKHHAYRALYHARKQKRLNLPILANWLFLIEQYNNYNNTFANFVSHQSTEAKGSV